MSSESTQNGSSTDWDRLKSMRDEDIDFSDCPEVTPEMFASAVVKKGTATDSSKSQVTLRIDSDVLAWFKSKGQDYQACINALLKDHVEAQKQSAEL